MTNPSETLFFLRINLWKSGVRGAPCPPATISAVLKSATVFILVIPAISSGLPICKEKGEGAFGACFMVCPWLPIATTSELFTSAFCSNLLAAFPKTFPSSRSNFSISTLDILSLLTSLKNYQILTNSLASK